jgi:hypothetical protein
MQLFRRHLVWVVCGWLVCQLAGVAAAPIMLLGATATHDEQECDCPVAPGQACPMHHSGKHDTTCKMRNAFGGPEAALFALSGGFGVLPRSTVTVSAFIPGAVVLIGRPSAILRAHRPESPPPRA